MKNEQMINRPLMLLVGLIVIFMVAMMFISCSENPAPPPPPKYDANLLKPPMHLRLGHTYEQIEYWEDKDLGTTLVEKTDTSMKYSASGDDEVTIEYTFNKNNKCWLTSMTLYSYSKNHTVQLMREFEILVGEYGFFRSKDYSKFDGGMLAKFDNKVAPNVLGIMWIIKNTDRVKHTFQMVQPEKR